ncbi:MAG TPA: gamma-glutamylcyclotransferase [Candidatus Onthousia faecavium]|nr:gamma-glutamylcyclotransferase [Candidatus Onthousia faecavium]
MKKFYLAYGSNLNLKQMEERCNKAIPIGTTLLNDYRLAYKGNEDDNAYLTIEKCKNSTVPLGIFAITSHDEKALDQYEGYPEFYYKEYIPIQVNGKIKEAMIYIMNNEYDYHLPSNIYVTTCEKGYEDFGFNKKILNEALEYTKKEKAKRKTLKL